MAEENKEVLELTQQELSEQNRIRREGADAGRRQRPLPDRKI